MDIYITSDPTVTDVDAALELAREIDQGSRWPHLEPKLIFSFARNVPTHHVFARHGSTVVGYAHLAFTASADGPSAEIMVAPKHRLEGVGRALLNELRKLSNMGFRVWCHGLNSGAFGFANRTALALRQQIVLLKYPNESLLLRDLQGRHESQEHNHVDLRQLARTIDGSYPESRPADSILSQSWFTPDLVATHFDETGYLDGVLVLRPIEFDQNSSVEIHAIAVRPEAQGKGVGKRLIHDSLDLAKICNFQTVISYVDLTNPLALRAHFRSGFEWVSVDAIFMDAGNPAPHQRDRAAGLEPQ